MALIVYLIDNLLRAGTQTTLGYLVEGLANRGYRQEIYCLNRRFDPGVIDGLQSAGAQVVVLGKASLLTGAGLARLYAALRRTDVLQTFLPASDVIGRTVGRLARVPLVVTSIRARNVDKTPWQLWLDRRTMRWAHRVVFNAPSVIDFAIAHEGVQLDQAIVVPNGVRFRGPSGKGRQVVEGLVPIGAPVIGTVGRLRPQKGHAVLIDALARMAALSPGVVSTPAPHLVVVGAGELRGALEAQVRAVGLENRVHFLGARSDLPDLYAAMDVYAHPAGFEGMPNAVMEAMAAGLPVVASDVDGTRELIRDGETGWLVPSGDAAALAARLMAVLADRGPAAAVGAAASKSILAEFSVEQMINGFDRVYRTANDPHEM
jgi:glycosyltransferase involved in cell wall biosynthesis